MLFNLPLHHVPAPPLNQTYTQRLYACKNQIFKCSYCIAIRANRENMRKNMDLPYTEQGAGVHGFLEAIGFIGLAGERGTRGLCIMTDM